MGYHLQAGKLKIDTRDTFPLFGVKCRFEDMVSFSYGGFYKFLEEFGLKDWFNNVHSRSDSADLPSPDGHIIVKMTQGDFYSIETAYLKHKAQMKLPNYRKDDYKYADLLEQLYKLYKKQTIFGKIKKNIYLEWS